MGILQASPLQIAFDVKTFEDSLCKQKAANGQLASGGKLETATDNRRWRENDEKDGGSFVNQRKENAAGDDSRSHKMDVNEIRFRVLSLVGCIRPTV